MTQANGIGKACPLCGAPSIGYDLYACARTDAPCDLDQIDAALTRQAAVGRHTAAFLRSLPEKYHHMMVSQPHLTAAQEQKVSAMTPRGMLYLAGDAAAGKTHTAVWKAASWLSEGYSAMYIEEQAYFRALMASFRGGDVPPDLLSPDILIWDDFGRKPPSKGSDFVYSEVFHVISQRYAHERATIFTSNFSVTRALERLTDDADSLAALTSRMRSGQALRFEASGDPRKGSAI